MTTSPTKFDTDKPRYDLLPPKALGLLVDCLTYGAKKYDDYNWRKDGGIDPNRLFAATQRHLWAWKDGETMDKESGLPHLAHAATNLLMMLDLTVRPPVKIPNFNPKPVAKALDNKPTEGPMSVYPLDKEVIEKAYSDVVGYRYDRDLCVVYDIVNEPEDVRYFYPDSKTLAELERLGVFTRVSAFTDADGKERWTCSRTELGHAVREHSHKIEAKVEPETELELEHSLLSNAESEAYCWIFECSPESRAYRALVDPSDWVYLDNTEDNRKFAESLSTMFEKTSTAHANTITLQRTFFGHKIRSLLNAKP